MNEICNIKITKIKDLEHIPVLDSTQIFSKEQYMKILTNLLRSIKLENKDGFYLITIEPLQYTTPASSAIPFIYVYKINENGDIEESDMEEYNKYWNFEIKRRIENEIIKRKSSL